MGEKSKKGKTIFNQNLWKIIVFYLKFTPTTQFLL